MQLEILTREKVVLNTDILWVNLPAENGEIGILPQHAPLVTTLDSGVLSYQPNGKTTFVAVHYGYARIDGEKVIVMCKMCELVPDIDLKRAQEAEQKAGKTMQEMFAEQASPEQMQVYAAKLKRAIIRQSACQSA